MKAYPYIFLLFILFVPAISHSEDYVIGEGDTLKISVWGSPDLSLSVKVRPDGKITIPALGDVSAAGETPNDLQKSLTVKLKRLVKDPVVTVIVEEMNNNKVFVFGGGVKPVVVDLKRRTTLLQLLVMISQSQPNLPNDSQGDLNNADLHKSYVLRKGKKIKEDFNQLLIKGDLEDDIAMMPDDVVFIPALDDKNVYVVGAVNTPKFIEYREGLTVMEAILACGGFTKFAKENSTVIFRKNGNKEVVIPVKLNDLVKGGDMSQNLKLKPGDYIVVKEGIF